MVVDAVVFILAGVIASPHDQQRGCTRTVSRGEEGLGGRPSLSQAIKVGGTAGTVAVAANPPLEDRSAKRRIGYVEGIQGIATAAHGGIDPCPRGVLVGRDRTIEAIGLRQRIGSRGRKRQPRKVDGDRVVTQPLELGIELRRHEGPQFSARDNTVNVVGSRAE
ncbi:hypothetical protein D3C84_916580 [compost metagenome]